MLFPLPLLPSLPVSCSCSGAEQKDGGWGLPYDFSLSSWHGAKLPQLWKSDKREKKERKKKSTNSGDLEWQNKKNRGLGLGFFPKKQKRGAKGKSMNKQVERTWMDKMEGGHAERPRF